MSTTGLITCKCGKVNRVEYPNGEKICECGNPLRFTHDARSQKMALAHAAKKNPRRRLLDWLFK